MNEEHDKKLDGKLYRVFHSFGCDFPVRYKFSDDDNCAIPDYPDFINNPEYATNGSMFTLTVQESCKFSKSDNSNEKCEECGSCIYFRYEMLGLPIGICCNENLKKKSIEQCRESAV